MTLLAASGGADQPGTLGFLVVAGMGLILVFLFRSMSKHLRKVSGGTGQDGVAASSPVPNDGMPGTSWDSGSSDSGSSDSGSSDSGSSDSGPADIGHGDVRGDS